LRAAIYLRVSTAGQSGPEHVSLTVQEDACRSYVQGKGGDVIAILRDEGRSGLDNERPAYLDLFKLAATKAIDTVIAYRLDRFGRDAAELLMATKTMRSMGVAVVSATEPTESNLVAGIIALLAQDESERIRARTLPAMYARLKEGKWVGPAPVGYSIVDHPSGGKTLRANDAAWKVARLFEIYAGGKHSLRDLAREAALLDVSTDRTRLSRMLRNPAYIGRSVWGRKQKLDSHHSRARQQDEWLVYPGLHAPVVEPEVFARVQAMLSVNRERQGPPPPGRQLLIGRLRCGSCGSPMYAMQRKRAKYPDKVYHSYKCPRKHERQGCPQPTVATWMADDQVKQQLRSSFRLCTPERLSQAEAIIAREQDSYMDGTAQRKRQLERVLARLEGEQRSLTRKLARGVVTEKAYRDAFGETESLAASVRRELADLVDVQVPDLSASLRLVASIGWADLEAEDWRDLVLGFCERIDLHGKAVVITWTHEALRRVIAAALV
jgi:DNA invertase Pin-like site-specific DNA recombinase